MMRFMEAHIKESSRSGVMGIIVVLLSMLVMYCGLIFVNKRHTQNLYALKISARMANCLFTNMSLFCFQIKDIDTHAYANSWHSHDDDKNRGTFKPVSFVICFYIG